ncbi:MAG: ribbon-helix-helix protein, CopG family [Chloroflexi bacterium]|nr:ribbon-helix-helix protein, CopG family [Chloroflexota bacterium]MCZ7577076.1 ribbon-helix-helix protein, CopG family [Dehalococcoidia bacterium]
MKKTSVYLSDEDRARLARLAEREGKSQALVLREALAMYDASRPDRNFEIFSIEVDPEAPGLPRFETAQEFQDWLDTEGLKGFGADSLGDEPLS